MGNITRQLQGKKEQLCKAKDATIGGKSKKGDNDLLPKEGKMWRQRSRTLWLHKGDGNARFFHSQATYRFRRNRIEVLENSKGERCEEEGEI